ncbi:MAG: pilus assembly protein [Polyangiaceae bacterium]
MFAYPKNSTRGAASVEAVVVLPVFVILLVGLFFVRDLTRARLRADQEVRRCAWQYAMYENCEQAPPGCEEVVGKGHYGALLPDKLDDAINSLGSGSKGGSSEGYARVRHVLENFVERYLAQAVTKRFDAEKTVKQARPPMFGGGTRVLRGKYDLACNVRPQRQRDVVTAVWNQFKP